MLLEGREATVNYVDTPYRYTLTMSDTTVLGQRRAAQVLAATALKAIEEAGAAEVGDEAVMEAINGALAQCTSVST